MTRTDCGAIALWAVTIAEVVVFTLCGAIMYHFVGNQYITAPAFGSLVNPYKKIAFSFAIPTIIFLGALYAVRVFICMYIRCKFTGLFVLSTVRHGKIHILPHLPQLASPTRKYVHRVGYLGLYPGCDMDRCIRHCGSHPVFLRYAKLNELVVWCVHPVVRLQTLSLTSIAHYLVRWMVRVSFQKSNPSESPYITSHAYPTDSSSGELRTSLSTLELRNGLGLGGRQRLCLTIL